MERPGQGGVPMGDGRGIAQSTAAVRWETVRFPSASEPALAAERCLDYLLGKQISIGSGSGERGGAVTVTVGLSQARPWTRSGRLLRISIIIRSNSYPPRDDRGTGYDRQAQTQASAPAQRAPDAAPDAADCVSLTPCLSCRAHASVLLDRRRPRSGKPGSGRAAASSLRCTAQTQTVTETAARDDVPTALLRLMAVGLASVATRKETACSSPCWRSSSPFPEAPRHDERICSSWPS